MADTNLSVKMLALGIISKIAAGMGQPFDKHARVLTAPVASVCADQKATTRTAGVTTLSAMAEAAGGLDSMFAGLATSLESPNPALRASVLGWLAERLQIDTPSHSSDMTSLAAPILSCLEDRNGDVRKSATAVLPFVVASAGYDYVMDQTSNLKPASKATIIPLIATARNNTPAGSSDPPAKPTVASTGPSKVKATAATTVPAAASPARPAARTAGIPARSLAMKALASAPPVRPMSNGDERPTAVPKARMTTVRPPSAMSHAPPAASSSADGASPPFVTNTPEARSLRLKKDAARWVLDASPKAGMVEYLSQQMEHHASPELYSLLFSKDHRAEEDYMAALSSITEFFSDDAASSYSISAEECQQLQLANVDLALKYAAIKLLSNNTQLGNRCLEVISRVMECLQKYNERFSDAEAKLFVPALIVKVSFWK